jgi:hypothetical protein
MISDATTPLDTYCMISRKIKDPEISVKNIYLAQDIIGYRPLYI